MQAAEIKQLNDKLAQGFKLEEGPFNQGLDRALKSFKVEREAYYGGTFIGNHVNKCLKVNPSFLITMKVTTFIFIQAEHIATLCLAIVKVAEEKCPSLLPKAHSTSEKFTTTFTLFSHCHSLYTSKFLTMAQIESLGQHQI